MPFMTITDIRLITRSEAKFWSSGDRATALRIGHAYQNAADWHLRVPDGLAD
jgi:hypothetical protein